VILEAISNWLLQRANEENFIFGELQELVAGKGVLCSFTANKETVIGYLATKRKPH
jgi:hypothetical protein